MEKNDEMRFLISRGHSKKNSKLGIPNMKKVYTHIHVYTKFFHQKMVNFGFKRFFGASFFTVNGQFRIKMPGFGFILGFIFDVN